MVEYLSIADLKTAIARAMRQYAKYSALPRSGQQGGARGVVAQAPADAIFLVRCYDGCIPKGKGKSMDPIPSVDG